MYTGVAENCSYLGYVVGVYLLGCYFCTLGFWKLHLPLVHCFLFHIYKVAVCTLGCWERLLPWVRCCWWGSAWPAAEVAVASYSTDSGGAADWSGGTSGRSWGWKVRAESAGSGWGAADAASLRNAGTWGQGSGSAEKDIRVKIQSQKQTWVLINTGENKDTLIWIFSLKEKLHLICLIDKYEPCKINIVYHYYNRYINFWLNRFKLPVPTFSSADHVTIYFVFKQLTVNMN